MSDIFTSLSLPPEWTRDALCASVDPDIFFPDQGGSAAAAKRICGQCPVQAACLNEALSSAGWHGSPLLGIWGGVTAHDRRHLKAAS